MADAADVPAEDTAAAGDVAAAETDAASMAADDSQAAGTLSLDSHDNTDCQQMSSSQSDAADVSVSVQLLAPSGPGPSAADCGQLLTDRHVSECDAADAAAAAVTETTVQLLDSATDSDCVQVLADAVATDDAAAQNIELPAAAVPNEPPNEPQPAAAADAEVIEPVGNIIPPPLAVLAPQGLGDVHQAMMQGGGPVGFQPYKHPNLFALRVIVSLCLLSNLHTSTQQQHLFNSLSF